MTPRKLRVGIARFPYAGNGATQAEHPAIGDWLAATLKTIWSDPRCEPDVWKFKQADTPIPMVRNRAAHEALRAGVDVLVMVDSDQVPDVYLRAAPNAKPFWDSSFEFLYERYDRGPCVVFAPYCGPPVNAGESGVNSVFCFLWRREQFTQGGLDLERMALQLMTPEESLRRAGIEELAAGPTGLCMIDVRAFRSSALQRPWFDYEWCDDGPACPACGRPRPGLRTHKASTEDVYFTRNCSLAGVRVFCNWDAWAGHAKPQIVGKPIELSIDDVSAELADAVRRGFRRDEVLTELNPGKSVEEVLASFRPAGPDGEGTARVTREDVLVKVAPEDFAMRVRKSDSVTPGDDHQSIPGWFDFADLYRQQVLAARPDAHFVEVGGFLGRSAVFMGQAIKESGKRIWFDVVDTWRSEDLAPHLPADSPDQLPSGLDLLMTFLGNVRRCGVTGYVHPVALDSISASARYAEGTLDFVFLDSDHRYAPTLRQLEAWWSKVRPGGRLAGHDYRMSGVRNAALEFADTWGIPVVEQGDCFVLDKPLPQTRQEAATDGRNLGS